MVQSKSVNFALCHEIDWKKDTNNHKNLTVLSRVENGIFQIPLLSQALKLSNDMTLVVILAAFPDSKSSTYGTPVTVKLSRY